MDWKRFFDAVRTKPGGGFLSAKQVDGINAIVAAFDDCRLSWVAYALATAWHETATTMQPIHERGGPEYLRKNYDVTGMKPERARKNGNTEPGDGVRYAGRGYVQITWKNNYAKLSPIVGVDLVADPDKAMDPIIAAKIMRAGMEQGLFTGRSLSDFLTAERADYSSARRIINGVDRAAEIAKLAAQFDEALRAAGYAPQPKASPRPPEPRPEGKPPAPAAPAPEPAKPATGGFLARFLAALGRRLKGA